MPAAATGYQDSKTYYVLSDMLANRPPALYRFDGVYPAYKEV